MFEVLAVDNFGPVYVVGQNGVIAGGWPRTLGTPVSGPPAVGDLDGDGIPEVVTVTQNGRVSVWTNTNGQKFSTILPSPPIGGPVLAPMANTRQPSILRAGHDRT